MMKKFALALALLLAACTSSARAATVTPNYGITVPSVAETGWGPPLQTWANNFIDNSLLINGVAAPNGAVSAFKEGWAITLDSDNDTPAPQSVLIRGPTGNVITRTTEGGPFSLGTGINLEFEGSVNDSFQTTLTVANPTADRTLTLPNASGTLALTSNLVEAFPTGCPDGEGLLASSGSMVCSAIAGGGGGGAPTTASYFVGAADGALTNEIVLPPTDDNAIVANGTTWQTKLLPSCNGANQALTYNVSTNTYGCVTISSGGAPLNAQYLVAAADGSLSNEVVVSPIDDGVQVGSGATWQVKVVPSCSGATNALTYNNSTNTYGCNTIAGGGGSSSGVAGRVQFSNGSGGFLSDNALQWDNSNKRLGIGTTAPDNPLDVRGNTTVATGGANPSTYPGQVGPFSFTSRFAGAYTTSGTGYNATVGAKIEATGNRPAVAVAGFGYANSSTAQAWGGNFVGTVNSPGSTGIGIEINNTMLQPGLGVGLLIHSAGFSPAGRIMQLASNHVASKYQEGIQFSAFYSGGEHGGPVQTSGSLILTAGTVTAGWGINFNTAQFTSKVALLTGQNSIELRSLTGLQRPGPAAARLFLQEIGGGRSQLCALFDTGVSQCFATEP